MVEPSRKIHRAKTSEDTVLKRKRAAIKETKHGTCPSVVIICHQKYGKRQQVGARNQGNHDRGGKRKVCKAGPSGVTPHWEAWNSQGGPLQGEQRHTRGGFFGRQDSGYFVTSFPSQPQAISPEGRQKNWGMLQSDARKKKAWGESISAFIVKYRRKKGNTKRRPLSNSATRGLRHHLAVKRKTLRVESSAGETR